MNEIKSFLEQLSNKTFINDRGEECKINTIFLGNDWSVPSIKLSKHGGSVKTDETIVDFIKFYKIKS